MTDGEFVDDLPPTSPSTDPPAETLEWVGRQVGAEVVGFEALVGGLSSAVHRLSFDSGPDLVLRRYTVADWLAREPHIPHDEARILATIADLDLGVPTPRFVAADPDGRHCDVPALLMTVVPGRPVLRPVDPVDWAERLAATLALMHRQPPIEGMPAYRRWDAPDRPLPTWTQEPALWAEALDRANVELPTHPEVFLHRDFHPNNVHWDEGGNICAVVDWLNACNGPVAVDLCHCRGNLAVLFDASLADHFTAHYRALTGYSEELLLYDLSNVLDGPVGPFPTHGWNSLGRTDLTTERVAVQQDRWLSHILGGSSRL